MFLLVVMRSHANLLVWCLHVAIALHSLRFVFPVSVCQSHQTLELVDLAIPPGQSNSSQSGTCLTLASTKMNRRTNVAKLWQVWVIVLHGVKQHNMSCRWVALIQSLWSLKRNNCSELDVWSSKRNVEKGWEKKLQMERLSFLRSIPSTLKNWENWGAFHRGCMDGAAGRRS